MIRKFKGDGHLAFVVELLNRRFSHPETAPKWIKGFPECFCHGRIAKLFLYYALDVELKTHVVHGCTEKFELAEPFARNLVNGGFVFMREVDMSAASVIESAYYKLALHNLRELIISRGYHREFNPEERSDFANLLKLYSEIGFRQDLEEGAEETAAAFSSELLVTSAEMKALEKRTIEYMFVPSLVLMERAALAVVDALKASDFDLSKVICVCGRGNNGADGAAVARLLHLAGHAVEILYVGDIRDLLRQGDDARQQRVIANAYGVPVGSNGLQRLGDLGVTTVVDALFGIGLNKPLEDEHREAVLAINALRDRNAKVLSIDIPSGISADTGQVLGSAVKADVTVTFAYNKVGLTCEPGRDHAGRIIVADIGIYKP
jgi:hydroxyethylthiazole kinase-like uncharacterized protein yjeF